MLKKFLDNLYLLNALVKIQLFILITLIIYIDNFDIKVVIREELTKRIKK
jgi:hypothetical protein